MTELVAHLLSACIIVNIAQASAAAKLQHHVGSTAKLDDWLAANFTQILRPQNYANLCHGGMKMNQQLNAER